MNILMTGGTGLIGTALQARLLKAGYSLTVLTRNAARMDRERAHFTFVFGNGDVGAEDSADAWSKGVTHGLRPN